MKIKIIKAPKLLGAFLMKNFYITDNLYIFVTIINHIKMKELKVFYHSADLDGIMSGAILKTKFPNADFQGWDYKDNIPKIQDLLRYKKICLVDITFPIDYLNLLGESIDVIVIDHHISFKKQADQLNNLNFEYVYNNELSACEIAYKHFISSRIPFLLKAVGDYDTWRTNNDEEKWNTETMPFQMALKTDIITIEDGKSLLEFADDYETIDRINKRGLSIYHYVNTEYKKLAKDFSFEKRCFGNLRGLFLNIPIFNADMLKSVYDSKKHDILVGFNIVGDSYKVSLRCPEDKDIDVSEIARRFGGGGHKKASGFQIDDISVVYDKESESKIVL